MKTCFPDPRQIKICQKHLCKECTYVKKYINESDETFYSTEDNEPTFSSYFFQEGPVVNVENIEERLK